MKAINQEKIVQDLQAFHLPKYQEIPNVGLYLEQVSQYIEEYFAVLTTPALTGSMISNYVKKKLLSHPQKKRYNRAQIATLILIAVTKTVLSMEDIRSLLDLIEVHYELPEAYDYFCELLTQSLEEICQPSQGISPVNREENVQEAMLHHTCVTAAHKIYLDKCYDALRTQADENEKDLQV